MEALGSMVAKAGKLTAAIAQNRGVFCEVRLSEPIPCNALEGGL